MGQAANQSPDTLEQQIDDQRQKLESNIDELEGRAKQLTDWEYQFQQRPLLMVGIAFGGGVLLGSLLGGSSSKDQQQQQQAPPQYQYQQMHPQQQGQRHDGSPMGWITGSEGPTQSTQSGKQQAAGKVDEMRGALMGLAATKVEDFLKESLPGFNQQVEKIRQKESQEQRDRTEQDTHTAQSSRSR